MRRPLATYRRVGAPVKRAQRRADRSRAGEPISAAAAAGAVPRAGAHTTCNRQRATDSVQQTACNRQCATDNVQQTACNRQRDHVVYSQRRLRGAVRASRRRHQSAHRHASVGPARPHRLRVSSGAALPCGGLRSIQLATTCDNMRQHATACGVHAATGMGLSAARRDEYADAHAATHTRTQKGIVLLRCSVLQFLPAWRAGHAAGVLAGALHKLRRGAKCPAAQSPADYLCATVAQLALGKYCRDSEQHVRSSDSDAADGSALHAKLVEASRTGLHAAAGSMGLWTRKRAM